VDEPLLRLATERDIFALEQRLAALERLRIKERLGDLEDSDRKNPQPKR